MADEEIITTRSTPYFSEDLDYIAEEVLSIPHDKRTLSSVFKSAVFKKPALIIDVLKVFAGV